ncbi:MAG: MurR/RpiR family transcriptional regulator [Anaerolineales bacterium]|nr:MAG: MurR/RpiR family transcriptional regulator [Anaerolineales bacterium]
MSLKHIVENYPGDLTPSDESLIQELLANPQEAAYLTAAELAARVGVHESTAVRLAQKIGYRGYRELRSDLREELMDTVDSAERIRRSLGESEVLASLVSDEIAALQEMLQTVSQEQLDQASKIIINAERVFLYARGHATSLVEYTDRRLRRSGFRTVDLRGRGRELAEQVITLTERDALLGFAMRKKQPALEALLKQAAQLNVPSILISDPLGPIIRPRPTVLLWARRGVEGQFQSHAVSLTICSALTLTIARHDEGRTFESLDRLASLVKRYEKIDI